MLLMVWGVFRFLAGDGLAGIWSVLIGWFLREAAAGAHQQARLDETLLRRIADLTAGQYLVPDPEAMEPGEAVDPDLVYTSLRSELVSRDERLEVTSLLAGSGIALLVAAVTLSLLGRGRLP